MVSDKEASLCQHADGTDRLLVQPALAAPQGVLIIFNLAGLDNELLVLTYLRACTCTHVGTIWWRRHCLLLPTCMMHVSQTT